MADYQALPSDDEIDAFTGKAFWSLPLLLLSIAPFFGAYALLADAKKDWPILLYGAGGWWLALLMRVPVAVLADSASQQSWLQLVTTLVSGPAEESVRVTMLFTFGWAARFDATFALGLGWTALELVFTCVQSLAATQLLKAAKSGKDPKAVEAFHQLAAQSGRDDPLSLHPAWGILERFSAHELHLAMGLLGALSPWMVLGTSCIHSAVNWSTDFLMKKRAEARLQGLGRTVVIDVGSGICKAGTAGEDEPSCRFPSIIGRPKQANVMQGSGEQDHYIGEEAQAKRGILKISYPVEHGIVQDWEDMELIWRHTFFNELRVQPTEQAVLLAEAAPNPKANRERMTQIMFEVFYVPALYITTQAVLAMYSSGRTTGIVCDSGDGVTHVVPVYEGFLLPHAVARADLAGRDLTEYLMKLVVESGTSLSTTAEREIARDMKEKCCYVADNFDEELKKAEATNACASTHELPDGNVIRLNSERFKCPEALFNPELVGRPETEGVHTQIYKAIMRCDLDIRKELFANVVVSGGSTCFPGFGRRLQAELAKLIPSTVRIRVLAPDDRRFSVFIGGAMLADLDLFTDMCVDRTEYLEDGPAIVHKKCI
ncbi:ACT3 [Symbiodinium necroappetens]|uniref:ACT3 protein n=1 Tax=Symbiodinium necroappetens TaxID=1628268 RepID=A0A812NXC3_9DINO|nr:ACT3 [Symbiodinium necroappetens]